jgi:hypothetical protein
MIAESTTAATPQAEVCLCTEKVRNANTERQARFRQSEKGKAAYEARLNAKRAASAFRRNARVERFWLRRRAVFGCPLNPRTLLRNVGLTVPTGTAAAAMKKEKSNG